ncbi:MAG: histidinol-phosphatase HisJ family protein [Clostridia bacterium]|nr:histidinol-phosphatase HisJ family protein [Clostridia bacterium]
MKRDYHMHPNILKVPGQAEKFAKRAADLGFEEICFTDHMPFSLTPDESDRIEPGMVSQYCEKVRETAQSFKNIITIKTGIEIDFHPDYTEEVKSVLADGSFDYVLGSSHLNIAGYGIDMEHTSKSSYAAMVIENYIKAAESGLFDTITHIDVYRWVFSAYPLSEDGFTFERIRNELERLFSVLERTGVQLEINAAPLYKRFDSLGPYPEYKILEMAKDYKINYIYGSDAHMAEHVGFGYDLLKKFL